jgi:hypothetical protein
MNATTDKPAPVQAAALTVSQFSEAHGFGRNRYFALQREGLAPRTFRIGKRVMISAEAARDWREMMERRTAEQAPAPAHAHAHAPAPAPAPSTPTRIQQLRARKADR